MKQQWPAVFDDAEPAVVQSSGEGRSWGGSYGANGRGAISPTEVILRIIRTSGMCVW